MTPVSETSVSSGTLELVCFPPAGGSEAMFKEWGGALGSFSVRAVNIRRRAASAASAADLSLTQVARSLAGEVAGYRPYALVGHSLGGLIAFETARAICSQPHLRRPECVVVMGSRPPHRSSASVFAPMLALNDDNLLDALEHSGAVNPALKSSPLRPLFMPALRADLRLITTYQPNVDALRRHPLPVDLFAWHGSADSLATPGLGLEWSAYTSARFTHCEFDGGHFFPVDRFDLVSEALLSLLPRFDFPQPALQINRPPEPQHRQSNSEILFNPLTLPSK